MSKILVAYFSPTGTTARLAKALASELGADEFEIVPEVKYTKADLDWTNPKSRSSIEMNDNSSYRPPISGRVATIGQYDVIFVGFPIWWYVAPTIINSFLEQYDLKGKTVVPFATSGTSGMGQTNRLLKPSCKGARLIDGRRFPANASGAELKKWALNYI